MKLSFLTYLVCVIILHVLDVPEVTLPSEWVDDKFYVSSLWYTDPSLVIRTVQRRIDPLVPVAVDYRDSPDGQFSRGRGGIEEAHEVELFPDPFVGEG